MLSILDRFLAICDKAFLFAATLCLGVMFAANAFNMVYRAIFDTSFGAIWPWTMLLFVWSVFLGFFVLYRRNRDVCVDTLVSRLPLQYKNAAALFACGVTATVMGVMLAVAPQRLLKTAGVIELVGLPKVVLSIPFFLSCLLIFLNCIVQAAALTAALRASGARPALEG